MIKIRKYKRSDAYSAAKVICETYGKFNKNEGPLSAVKNYISSYDPDIDLETIKKRFSKSTIFYVALFDAKIVGIIRGMNNRLVNLFVSGKHHRKGIGFMLIKKFENECKKKGYQKIKVRASLYGVPFYNLCGYKKTTGVRNFIGLKVQPMEKRI